MSFLVFLVLGIGRLGYFFDFVVKIMFKCCIDFLCQKRLILLKEIIFVVYYEDKDIFYVSYVFLNCVLY